ncbi:MAG TPA: glycosyl hydrolase [Verrucomicrobiae bacterium]|nr:glycosyl hydrolase [Verrucomicrobiae bacterium]
MKISAAILCLGLSPVLSFAVDPAPADPLAAGFASPPASARPQTWWHWMNGNVTKEGITADLEAMQRVGIGGVQIFNAGEGIPAGPVKFNSPEWHDMFKFAVSEADRLGLEVCIHNCAGWSSSGGPWNTYDHSMMHMVSSETNITGGQKFSAVLPQPPMKWDFYKDIEVVAFPTIDGEGARMKSLAPKITSSVKNIDGNLLVDGKLNTTVSLPTNDFPQYIQFEFAQPFATRSATLTFAQESGDIKGVIQVSDDGKTYRDLRTFMTPRRPTRPLSFSLGNAPVSARFFRVNFTGMTARTRALSVADIDLSPRLSIENVETKDGDTGGFISSSTAESSADDNLLIKQDGMIDLATNLSEDGHLDWDAPPGNWTVLRIGYTPYGRENHPAPPEGTGPECDKFSPEALDAHWDGFVQKAIDDAGPLAGKGKTFNNVLIDSYEVGGQNWSANFRKEFEQRRGYDPLNYLPAFTGRVVDSPEVSERFLWDVRRTISDLFAEKYYGHFAELCAAHNMTCSFEPYTGPYESLQVGATAEIPMGEFWVGNGPLDQSVKLASSVGHIYGRNVIGTESFTAAPSTEHGRWLDDPYAIKALGDQVFCTGINRYIFHRYAMQPWTNRWPGMTMGQWGTHFDRTSTWWEQGRAWLKYVTRSQFMLQQGRFVADAAYFDGENAPAERRDSDPELPPGYDFDAVGGTVLMDARVEDHQLVLKSGMRYRVLILPPGDRDMRPVLLWKISQLVKDGLTVVGAPPEKSPSLADYPNCDKEVKSIVTAVWGNCDGTNVLEKAFGQGKVVWGEPLAKVLAELNVPPDFEFSTTNQARLSYIHRQDGDAEIYFVSNQRGQYQALDGIFRVSGKQPELFHADTGVIEPAPVWREENGRTIVPLQFDPAGSVFVVFRHPAPADHVVAVTHSGFVAPKSKTPMAKLVIRSAIYDMVGGGKPHWADVTAAVKSQVADGQREITANNDLAGDDPVPNIVKALRVEFVLNGRNQTNEVAENEILELAAEAKVTRAIYGKLPSATTEVSKPVDVTKKLSKLVTGGTLNVRVANELTGSDPQFGQPKELSVEYSLNGVTHSVVVSENETLSIGQTGSLGEAPTFGLRADDAGNISVLAATAGKVELTTASGKTLRAKVSGVPAAQEVGGAWDLSFPPNWGAPPQVTLPSLMSWSDSTDKGVKYFSGTATYTKEIEIPAKDLGKGRSIWLDLGRVKNFAEVSLNGQPLGILWKPPFRVEITGAAQPGKNKLEVKVTNLWPNRLIGDEQLPDDREWTGKRLKEWPQWVLDGKPSPTGRFTFTTWHHWTKDEPLLESGLIGPVRIICAEEVPATR